VIRIGSVGRLAAAAGIVAAAASLAAVAGAQQPDDIPIAENFHPESIAATPDGGLIVGSVQTSQVWRIVPGAVAAEPWITEGLGTVLGVFAYGDTAYVCANLPDNGPDLLTFDLDTGAQTGAYLFPGGGFCNDIAVSPEGTVFVTDTVFGGGPGRVLALIDGENGPALQVILAARGIGGVDGLAFLGDALYVNDVSADKLYRLDLDGTNLLGFTAINLSQPIDGPDGMRTTDDGTGLLVAENASGRLSLLTIDGDNATVTVLAEGFEQPAGVAQLGDTAFVVQPLFARRGEDVGMFYAHAVPLSGL
jgi:sugar lactone lactonase YvrE